MCSEIQGCAADPEKRMGLFPIESRHRHAGKVALGFLFAKGASSVWVRGGDKVAEPAEEYAISKLRSYGNSVWILCAIRLTSSFNLSLISSQD